MFSVLWNTAVGMLWALKNTSLSFHSIIKRTTCLCSYVVIGWLKNFKQSPCIKVFLCTPTGPARFYGILLLAEHQEIQSASGAKWSAEWQLSGNGIRAVQLQENIPRHSSLHWLWAAGTWKTHSCLFGVLLHYRHCRANMITWFGALCLSSFLLQIQFHMLE